MNLRLLFLAGILAVSFLLYHFYTQNKFLKIEIEAQVKANELIIDGYETTLKVQKELTTIEVKNETKKEVINTSTKSLNQKIKEVNLNEKINNCDDVIFTSF